MRKQKIVIETGKHGRRILVYGFCNHIEETKQLMSKKAMSRGRQQ